MVSARTASQRGQVVPEEEGCPWRFPLGLPGAEGLHAQHMLGSPPSFQAARDTFHVGMLNLALIQEINTHPKSIYCCDFHA